MFADVTVERAQAVLAALGFGGAALAPAALKLARIVERRRTRDGSAWQVGHPSLRSPLAFGHPGFLESLRCDCRGPGTRGCAHAAAVLLVEAYGHPESWRLFVRPLAELTAPAGSPDGAVPSTPRAAAPAASSPRPVGDAAPAARPPIRYSLRPHPDPAAAPEDRPSAWLGSVLSRGAPADTAAGWCPDRGLLALGEACRVDAADQRVADAIQRVHSLGRHTRTTAQGSLFASAAPAGPTAPSPAPRAAVHWALIEVFGALAGVADLRIGDAPARADMDPVHLAIRIRACGQDKVRPVLEPALRATWAIGHGWVATAGGQVRPLAFPIPAALLAALGAPQEGIEPAGVAAAIDGLLAEADLPVTLLVEPGCGVRLVSVERVLPKIRVSEDGDALRIDGFAVYRAAEGEGTVALGAAGSVVSIAGGDGEVLLARRDIDSEARVHGSIMALLGRFVPCVLRGQIALEFAAGRLVQACLSMPVEGLDGLRTFNVAGTLRPVLLARDELDVTVRFCVGERQVSAGPVLRAFRHGASSVGLRGGQRALLPREWLTRHGTALEEIEELRRLGEGRLPSHAAPLLQAFLLRLDREAGMEGAGGDDESLARLRARLAEFGRVPDRPLPEGLLASLRAYQYDGFRWLAAMRDLGAGACLADEMGLGKTVEALALLLDEHGRHDRPPSLVVAPTSILGQWASEAARFAPSLRVHVHHGAGRNDPDGGSPSLDRADLVVTSYGILVRDVDLLASRGWTAIVLDEAQRIKNAGSRAAQAARTVPARFRLALSGTPLENDLGDLWSLFHFLMPGFFGSHAGFTRRYAAPARTAARGEVLGRLRARIHPFVLRRRKDEVATELPALQVRDVWCDLRPSQRAAYERVRGALASPLLADVDARGVGGAALHVLEVLLRLRQAACDPTLLPEHLLPEGGAWQPEEVAKRAVLGEILAEAGESGHRCIVFSQWTSLLDIVERDLEVAGTPFARIDGSTPDRASVVRRFQDPEGPAVLLASLKAGGAGLNLQAADHVVHLDPWWNPATEAQATARAHRIGRHRPVLAHRLLARGTVEERVLEIQRRKRELFDGVVEDDRLAVDRLSREDIEALLRPLPDE